LIFGYSFSLSRLQRSPFFKIILGLAAQAVILLRLRR